ncbi:hypothetical protein BX070DRAFT_225627 [Coemansia spiralis]|nr:hypothetical protein BX070DRAFT_225627 [Coemansia spiralis]
MELVRNANDGSKLFVTSSTQPNNKTQTPQPMHSDQRTPSPEPSTEPPVHGSTSVYLQRDSSAMTTRPPSLHGQIISDSFVNGKDDSDKLELGGVDMTARAVESFESIDKNIFIRTSSDSGKFEESLPCHCHYNPETDSREQACGESSDCINRLVQMECNPLTCPCGSYCLNRRFQKRQYAKVRIIDAGRKGYGMQALEDLDTGSFVMEYMGEVVTAAEFRKRARVYQSEGIQHHYFMSIGNGKIIDATRKGCIARFINHSCGPNCVLQKWMVGGAIRMGIFVERPIKRGEEITFDYKFERMSDSEPQPCYCGSPECKGIIGVTKERSKKAVQDVGSGEDADEDVAGFIDEEIEDSTVTRHQRDDIRRRHAAVDDEEYSSGYGEGYSSSEGGDTDSDGDGVGGGYRRIRQRINSSKKKKGLTSPEQVLKFVQIMHRSARQTRIIEILIGKLMETTDKRLLKSLIGLQGAGILRSWLQDYENDDVMLIKILQCISHLPISTRNTIEESRLEEVVKHLCGYSDENVANIASDIAERWSSLKHVFKIPKKSRKESASTTPAPGTPAASCKQSPNRNNTATPPVFDQHTADTSVSNNTGRDGRGSSTVAESDAPKQPRWRQYQSHRSANYSLSRMQSVSPARPYDASFPSETTEYASHVASDTGRGEGAGGWNRPRTGYRSRSPSVASHMNRPPARGPPYPGYRSRFGHHFNTPARSRSRSPSTLRRTASSYSRFSRFSGDDYLQSNRPYSSHYNSYGDGSSTHRDYVSHRTAQSPPLSSSTSYLRGRYSSWGGHVSHRPSSDDRSSSYNIDSRYERKSGYYEGDESGARPGSGSTMSKPALPESSSSSNSMRLASGWKTAYTNDGMAYYYHEVTKKTQWEPPLADTETQQVSSSAAPEPESYTNGSIYDRRGSLGLGEHRQQRQGQQYSHTGRQSTFAQVDGLGSRIQSSASSSQSAEAWAGAVSSGAPISTYGQGRGASSSVQSPSPTGDGKAHGVSKSKVDEIIERALRLGMQSSAQSTPGVNGLSSALSTQLVTPETDGEPTALINAQVKNTQQPTTLPGNSKPGNSRKVSSSSVSPSTALAPPAKREKLEKKATSELAAFVVRILSKYKDQLDHEQFKHEARKITKVLMEKERKAAGFDPHKLIELSQHKKTKIKQFVADYIARIAGRQSTAPMGADDEISFDNSSQYQHDPIASARTPPAPF